MTTPPTPNTPTWNIHNADARAALDSMRAESVDAIVTDPPYGIGFMGNAWDTFEPAYLTDARARGGRTRDGREPSHPSWAAGRYDRTMSGQLGFQAWCEMWARAAFRVLKPGGHLLAFGGARTYHRLACGVEDAGFEVRGKIDWIYGSGFPKSLNLTGEWEGWGTALKPGHEPILVARKPLAGTVANNVTTYGTGALNIDGCRLPFADDTDEAETKTKNAHARFGSGPRNNKIYGTDTRARADQGDYAAAGRWPADVIFDEEAARELDEQAGEPVSRFFYVAKPSSSERNRGLEHLPMRRAGSIAGGGGLNSTGDHAFSRNTHPTVKPIALMQYLCRLITPPNGHIIDPFCGSGTTGIAALREGFNFTGIEQNVEYVELARARIIGDAPLLNAAAEAHP